MGAVGGLLGVGGGAGNTGFNLNRGANNAQLDAAYGNVTNSQAAQQALLAALQKQQGLDNQSQVYNQFQGVANGTGPNPAMAQLNQTTGQNVANQSALMAGQRGAGANVGLIARQAANQGANTQQQAVGQGATLQANQALNALGAAGNIANTQAGQQIGQTNANTEAGISEQSVLQGANTAYNNNQAQLANTTLGGQQGAIGGLMNAGGGLGSFFGGGGGGGADPSSVAASGNFGGTLTEGSGYLGGADTASTGANYLGVASLAGGGEVGGVTPGAYTSAVPVGPQAGPQSEFGKYLLVSDAGRSPEAAPKPAGSVAGGLPGLGSMGGLPGMGGSGGNMMSMAGGAQDQLHNLVTGEDVKPSANGDNKFGIQGGDAAKGGIKGASWGSNFGPWGTVIGGAAGALAGGVTYSAEGGPVGDYRSGGKVAAKAPEQKAVKGGNSYANDKIPAMLSEHEIVLPRDITMRPDAPEAAKQFVAAAIAERQGSGSPRQKIQRFAEGSGPVDPIEDDSDSDESTPGPNVNVDVASLGQPQQQSQVPAALAPNDAPQAQDVTQYSPGRGEGSINWPKGTVADKMSQLDLDLSKQKALSKGLMAPDEPAGQDIQDRPGMGGPSSVVPAAYDPSQDQAYQEQPAAPRAPAIQRPPTFQEAQQANTNGFLQENQNFKQDLMNGQIKPETYQDLFAKKDTLGKVGSVFGMLLSGIGSGLTHQPSAYLQIMNNEIDRDLQAQVQNKENQRSLYSLELQRQHLKMEQPLMAAQTKEAQARAQLSAYTITKMRADNAFLYNQQMHIASMPEGPEKQKAQQALAAVSSLVDQNHITLANAAGAKMAMLDQATGGQGYGGTPAQGNGQNDYAAAARQIRGRVMAGIIPAAQGEAAIKELGQTQNHVALNQNAMDSFDKVAALNTLGARIANPIQAKSRIDAEWDPMIDKLTKDTEGRVTPITVDMMRSVKPELKDNADTLKLKRQKFSAAVHAGMATPNLDSIGMNVNKSDVPMRGGAGAGYQPIERLDPKTGRTVLYDPQTKKALGYK